MGSHYLVMYVLFVQVYFLLEKFKCKKSSKILRVPGFLWGVILVASMVFKNSEFLLTVNKILYPLCTFLAIFILIIINCTKRKENENK